MPSSVLSLGVGPLSRDLAFFSCLCLWWVLGRSESAHLPPAVQDLMLRAWGGVLHSSRDRACFLLISPSCSEPSPMRPFSRWFLFLTVEGGVCVSRSSCSLPGLTPARNALPSLCSAHALLCPQVVCRHPVSVDFKGLLLAHLHLAPNNQDLAGTSQLPSGTLATLGASQEEGLVALSPQLSCVFFPGFYILGGSRKSQEFKIRKTFLTFTVSEN